MSKLQLISGWRSAWRFASVQLALFGSFICSLAVAFPDAILFAWNHVPPDLKTAIPPRFLPLIGVALFALSIFARIVHQPKASAKIEEKLAQKEQQP